MKYIILFTIFLISLSCARKTNPIVEVKEEVTNLQFPADTVPQAIKNEIKIIKCSSVECDKLLVCYGQYFKFLYGNMDIPLKIDLLECALKVAESNNPNGKKLILDYYGSVYKPKDGGAPDWAKRLRGEDAFEITLEYMRQSKGENPGVLISKAWQIYNEVIASMIIFKDNINPKYFMVYQDKFPKTNDLNELENWITTDFIDILKKEIKEGRVVFKKYGE